MIVELTGVLQDGTPRAAAVPENTRQALRAAHGEDLTLRLRALKPDGSPLTVESRRYIWTVRRRENPEAVIKREGTPSEDVDGRVDFRIDDTETLAMEPGNYLYDVWTVDNVSGDQNPLVPLSLLVLEPSLYPVTPGAPTADPCPPIGFIPFTSLGGTLAELNDAISDADVPSEEEVLALFQPQYLIHLDEVGGGITYVGFAESPGTATNAALWRIFRLDESGTGGEELIKEYANGSTDFDQVWDDRAALSYT